MAEIIDRARRLGSAFWLAVGVGVLAAALAVQGVRCVRAAGIGRGLAADGEGSAPPKGRAVADDIEEYLALAKRANFGKEKPPQKPELFGILGQFAYMGPSLDKAEPYAAGAEVSGGFKIVEIGVGSVVIEKDGETETLNVFPGLDEAVSGAGPRPRPPQPPRPGPRPAGAPPPGPTPPQGASPAQAVSQLAIPEGIPPEARKLMEEARQRAMAAARAAGARP